jgi:acetolactate synthase-1/2/3 large subunit
MGYGLPAAIAAKIAEPGRAAVAFCGDGGFLMSVAELATVRRLALPLLVVVLTNDSYGSIRRHQRDSYRGRYVGVDLVNPELHQLASAFGLNSVRIDPGTDVERPLTAALASDTATLVEVPID